MILTSEHFEALTRPLIGLSVSLPWKGYGSAVFFELGDLSSLETKRAHHNKGAACISVLWDWRVEVGSSVLYGSSNSQPRIEAGIRALQGKTIDSLRVVGQVPELEVRFSNDYCLKSMVMVTGDPEWSIKTVGGQWIYVRDGKLQNGESASAASAQEEAAFALAERASIRWGVPASEQVAGRCAACVSFVPLDGNGHLLDYGCCFAEASPFDGRAVGRTSGCHAFASNSEI